jgi:ABC-type nitrate/sulfonate/bicarbonate transport system substrate-binding protein
MTMNATSPKHVVRLALAATVALALALPTSPALAADRVPVVNIPQNSWTVVAARLGWLQQEYAKFGSGVSLVDPGTTALVGAEASLLDRGDLHFAFRMIYPALVHKSNGLDARIVWLSTKSDVFKTPLIALKDSPINSAADLKGKTFASGRVGCGWSAPYETLLKAGVPLDTNDKKGAVRYSNVSNTNATVSALLAGQIDATATHVAIPQWASGVTQGLYKVIARTPDDGVYVNNAGRTAIFALSSFAEEHPELVKAFLTVQLRTIAWIQANPDQAAAIVARDLRIPVYVAKYSLFDAAGYDLLGGETSYDAAVASLKTFQAWYRANGDDILAKHWLDDATIASFVDRRFFKGGAFSSYEGAKLGDAGPPAPAAAQLSLR